MAGRIVQPEDYAAFFAEPLRRLQRSYACLVAVDEQNRSVAKGTVVFVAAGPIRLLVTARHVIRSEKMLNHKLLLLLSPVGADGLAIVGEEVLPVVLEFNPEVVFESAALDVAVLDAPRGLGAEARFLDGTRSADVATSVRKRWWKAEEAKSPFPYFVLGFPDFGHLIDAKSPHRETLSTMALTAYITQMEDHPWDGHTAPAPQLLMEGDARPDSIIDGASELQMHLAARLFRPLADDDKEPLGGLSGGPIVVVGPDGEFLLGLVKEGKRLFGEHIQIAGSCWDDCFAAFGRFCAQRVV
jgi:hypothetical protein